MLLFYRCSKDKILTRSQGSNVTHFTPPHPAYWQDLIPSFISGLPLEAYSWHQFSFFGCVNETASKEKDIEAGKKDPVRGLGLNTLRKLACFTTSVDLM